jgi:hypothetical protein
MDDLLLLFIVACVVAYILIDKANQRHKWRQFLAHQAQLLADAKAGLGPQLGRKDSHGLREALFENVDENELR